MQWASPKSTFHGDVGLRGGAVAAGAGKAREARARRAGKSSCLGNRYPTHYSTFYYAFLQTCLPLLDFLPACLPAYSTSLHCYSCSISVSLLRSFTRHLSEAARTPALTAQHLQTPQPINTHHAISQPAAANTTLSCLIEPEVPEAHRTFFHTSQYLHTLPQQ